MTTSGRGVYCGKPLARCLLGETFGAVFTGRNLLLGEPLGARYPNPNPRPLGRVSEVMSDGRFPRIYVTLTLTLGASGNRGENEYSRWNGNPRLERERERKP